MISVGLSTSCVFPSSTETAFRMARRVGFDGVEVMITSDPDTRSAETLRRFSDRYGLPILSVHAPVLFLSQLVWGTDAAAKLRRSADLARALGASTVVVHPPFRWQRRFAPVFGATVRAIADDYGVELAVENMFPCAVAGRLVDAYSPGSDVAASDFDAMTLDFSHASLAGQDSLELARRMGARLRHVHLTDGRHSSADGRLLDEHLIPGHGTQPVREVLQLLAMGRWQGSIVAEVATRHLGEVRQRVSALEETLDFARSALRTRSPLDATGTVSSIRESSPDLL